MPLIHGQSMLYILVRSKKKMIIQSFARFLAMPASYYLFNLYISGFGQK